MGKRKQDDGKDCSSSNVAGKRPRSNASTQDADIADADVVEAEYVVENGLRKVKPYWYRYETFAKGRWLGRSLYDVFVKEFQDQSPDYYRHAIETGLIRVNGQQVSPDHKLKNNERVMHRIHRHEPPVSADDVHILGSTPSLPSLVIINKPGSIPVHPSGRYRHNTVLHMVMRQLADSQDSSSSQPQRQIAKVFALNRLDRLTSGVMILCRDRKAIPQLERQFRERLVRKEYLCRVRGVFPADPITVAEPIRVMSHKLGLHHVHPDGKPSTTHFLRLSTNGRSSVVLARPVTGRTHQIRVHLQSLGYPILNDPLYAIPGSAVWPKVSDRVDVQTGKWKGAADTHHYSDSQQEAIVQAMTQIRTAGDVPFVPQSEESALPRCPECSQPLLPDPEPHQLAIYLHAYLYRLATTFAPTDLAATPPSGGDDDNDESSDAPAFAPGERYTPETPGSHEDPATGTTTFVSEWPDWAVDTWIL
ncbi:DRAP deaminase [Sorochytrium milnesiophthora]